MLLALYKPTMQSKPEDQVEVTPISDPWIKQNYCCFDATKDLMNAEISAKDVKDKNVVYFNRVGLFS